MLIPIILAGGHGKRLWPLSRSHYPKQLISLFNEYSLFQNTLRRVASLPDAMAPIILCNKEYQFQIKEQACQVVDEFEIIVEDVARNTAMSIALAALYVSQKFPDATLLITPTDHHFFDEQAWMKTAMEAQEIAALDKIVIFGITPTSPIVDYGYIKPGKDLANGVAKEVAHFIEKPNVELATAFYQSGEYLWNSGIFMFKASVILQQMKTMSKDILNFAKELLDGMKDENSEFIRIENNTPTHFELKSIDKAILEHTKDAVVIPLYCGWSDLGTWETLFAISEKDSDNNVLIGNIVTEDTENTYFNSQHRLVVGVGLENLYVVETKDALLIADKNKLFKIKDVLAKLEAKKQPELEHSPVVYRPWGHYEVIEHSDRYQVKHIHIKAGRSLSLQMHHHRAEHWVIVAGTARVTKGNEVFLVTENESVYIPCGTQHRLENPGKIPVHLIEIQTGSYLGEDDIIRYEDIYNRK